MAGHGYDTDLVLWAEDQARALRGAAAAASNLPIDWENVAEEIEALGKKPVAGVSLPDIDGTDPPAEASGLPGD